MPKKQANGKPVKGEVEHTVVVIGASAGGLKPVQKLLSLFGADCGVAFVLIMHLAADKKSNLTELISKVSRLEVVDMADGMELKPNRVHVLTPGVYATLDGKTVRLKKMPEKVLHLPIDLFLRSVSGYNSTNYVAVILSGSGTDGSQGIKAVKAEGGMVIAQELETADFIGMPQSAIETGYVDHVLPVEMMPEKILGYAEVLSQRISGEQFETEHAESLAEQIDQVLNHVRQETGRDFSGYKKNTTHRRIEKRMALLHLPDLESYLKLLDQDKDEIQHLFRELLIGVTHFFRDPEVFEALKKKALPKILQERPARAMVRVWVAGCSTGEEAYTLAMVLREYMEETGKKFSVQIFGTDMDAFAIDKARQGIYPDSIAADISQQRLDRFFIHEGSNFRIRKEIRSMLIFAVQDLIHEAPFSRLDLVSCRNLLIYLDVSTQKKIIPIFHYTLRTGGILLLGTSENIGRFDGMFLPLEKKYNIYMSLKDKSHEPYKYQFQFAGHNRDAKAEETRIGDTGPHGENLRRVTEDLLLKKHSPACLIMNRSMDILFFHGRTGPYLEPAGGQARLNALDMAREGLKVPLAAAVKKSSDSGEPVVFERVRVKDNGSFNLIDLEVAPLKEPESYRGLYLVLFKHCRAVEPAVGKPGEESSEKELDVRLRELESDLNSTREHLQTAIEELETSNEELRSTNEEYQSSNEELQSTNEELETSREELQSVNEELSTVNSELQSKIDELTGTNVDMSNMLASTDIAIVFLDNQLLLKRFTPAAGRVLNLIPGDTGRPLQHIQTNLVNIDLALEAEEVLDTLTSRESEVRLKNGEWMLMRVMPFRNNDQVIEGAVVTLIGISRQKKMESDLLDTARKLEDYYSSSPAGIALYDREGKLESTNERFRQMFGILDTAEMKGLDMGQYLKIPLKDRQALQAGSMVQMTGKINFERARKEGVFRTRRSGSVGVRIVLVPSGHSDSGKFKGFLAFIEEMETA